MKVDFSHVHCSTQPSVEENIELKLTKLKEKYSWIMDARVFLKMEKDSHNQNKVVEVLLKVPGSELFSSGRNSTFEQGAKKALEASRRQLRKYELKNFAHAVHNPLKE